MQPPKRRVRLYGRLGQAFGRLFEFALDTGSISEAIRALSCQVPGFKMYLLTSEQRGLRYAVFIGKDNKSKEQLCEASSAGDIRIAPVLRGAKNPWFQIVLGAVLIWTGVGGYIGSSMIASAVTSMGVAMVLGGVTQLISPTPKGQKQADKADNAPSYVFNGAVNTQAQGNPVPLGYGRMIVGSAVASAGIEASDYAPTASGVRSGSPLGSAKANMYDDEA